MIVTIQGRLPSLNEVIGANRANKYAGSKLKKHTQKTIEAHIKASGIGEYTKAKFSFKWYEPNMKRDFDNVSSATKFILDAFVSCGVIPNDGWKNVHPELNHKFYHDKHNPRIEVEIVEVEDE